MNRCEKCGRLISKSGNNHTCPENAPNKGLIGIQTAWNKGKELTEGHKKNISKSSMGKQVWNKGLKGGQVAWNKGSHINFNPNGGFKKGQMKGENNINWKGGITPQREQMRKRQEVVTWRKECFKRDNYTCKKTGVRTGGLCVHHINNFAEYPELQTDINNGVTLSKTAHKEFHDKYGYRNNTMAQLIEFLNS